jgi:hypothetical protein
MSTLQSTASIGSIGTTLSAPKDALLRSFNAFTTQDPTDILRSPKICIDKPIPDKDVVTETSSQRFYGAFKEFSSEQSMRTELAVSVGISGSYGVFSGSVQVDYQKSTYKKTTSFNSSYTAKLDCGAISYANTVAEMRKLIRQDLLDQLNAIANLGDAERFTSTYGTHLISGVGLGGTLFISVQAETSTVEDQASLSSNIKASYGGAFSMDAVASASSKVASSSYTSSVEQRIFTVGGSTAKASNIKPAQPDTFKDWAKSCTDQTAWGITQATLLYELATNTNARNLLKKYLSFSTLIQSLKQPVIFTKYRDLVQTTDVTVTVGVPEGYKILGGGATVSDGSSWLMGSYPESAAGGDPQAWVAMCHDSLHPAPASQKLAAYAIAVFDPEDLLEATVTQTAGTNRGTGKDEATASLAQGWLLTGGGCSCMKLSNSYGKWINSSYPLDKQKWKVNTSDYMVAAVNVETKAYAVGIRSKDPLLILDSKMVEATGNSSQHQNVQAVSKAPIVGGGVRIVRNDQGSGTRVQRSFPATKYVWEEKSGDAEGNITYSTASSYAIFLEPRMKMD